MDYFMLHNLLNHNNNELLRRWSFQKTILASNIRSFLFFLISEDYKFHDTLASDFLPMVLLSLLWTVYWPFQTKATLNVLLRNCLRLSFLLLHRTIYDFSVSSVPFGFLTVLFISTLLFLVICHFIQSSSFFFFSSSLIPASLFYVISRPDYCCYVDLLLPTPLVFRLCLPSLYSNFFLILSSSIIHFLPPTSSVTWLKESSV